MNRLASTALVAALVLAAASSSTLGAAAASDAEAGRAIAKRYADAIVGVELVVTIKAKLGDRELPPRENRAEVNGTAISADGLVVTTLAEVDPQSAFEAMRASQPGGNRIELLGADFKEVKLRLADGSEVPARFVLKDSDLDLAFMAPDYSSPETPKRQFPFVKLDEAAEGQVLGNYFNLSRAPKVLQRVPMVRPSQISGIVEKPRKVFLVNDVTVGTPTFDLAGKVLGISLQHFANGRRTGVVVVPSADIAEMAKQAVAAQAAAAK